MAGEWQVATFEKAPLQIIDGDRGKNYPSQTEFSPTGHCLFLNAGNVTTSGFRFSDCAFITAEKDAVLRKGKLIRGDVVLTTRGTVGNAAYFDDSIAFDHVRINSGMVILRARIPALQPRYLYLFVRSALFHAQVSELRTGSAQPQLPIQDINRIEIPIPPPDEQRAIAHILGTLDDKIELNRRMNETLEAMARALFKSWFVDFDPVRAKAEGRDSRLPRHLADLFPACLVYSELGEIPEGWEAGSFGSIVSQRSERVGSREVIVLSAVASGKLTRSDEHFTKRVYSKETDKYLLVQQWDFAYNPSRINIGSVGMLEEDVLGGVSPVYVVARPRDAYRWFLEFSLRLPQARTWINTLASGSVRQSLSYYDFCSIPCVIPPVRLAYEFNSIWSDLRDTVRARQAESDTLSALRDSLLPKLISGDLRVKDAERLVGRHA
jgi:type I restriction enzyme, S subunit